MGRKPNRTPNTPTGLPAWMERYLETGEVPEDYTEEARAFCAWQLLAGYSRYYGLGWPDPDVRRPDKYPLIDDRAQPPEL
jgi:hypothetical protein